MTQEVFEIIERLVIEAFNSRNAAKDYASKCKRQCVVEPGFPILWFGDLDTYLKTEPKKRAISVGVNPSGKELHQNSKGLYVHFPGFKNKRPTPDVNEYVEAMNMYFSVAPLNWFNKGMEEVPYSYEKGTLIHIDCCSTIATRPTWTGLCPSMQGFLKQNNKSLFEELLIILSPSKIYIASNKKEYDYIKSVCMSNLGLDDSSIEPIDKYGNQRIML